MLWLIEFYIFPDYLERKKQKEFNDGRLSTQCLYVHNTKPSVIYPTVSSLGRSEHNLPA